MAGGGIAIGAAGELQHAASSHGGARRAARAWPAVAAATPITTDRRRYRSWPSLNLAGRAAEYKGRLTKFVVFVAIIAASGGLLFGYDLVSRLAYPGIAAR